MEHILKCKIWDSQDEIWRQPFGEIYDFQEMLISDRFKVCLFIGLQDKFKQEIYQHDIIKSEYTGQVFEILFGEFEDTDKTDMQTSVGFYVEIDGESDSFGKHVGGNTDKFIKVGNSCELELFRDDSVISPYSIPDFIKLR